MILTGCSTNPSVQLTAPQPINEKLLEAPISSSLLVPCRVAYPLRLNPPETSLKTFYETYMFNLGQVEKCYGKDEDLVEEVKRREEQ